MCVCVCVCVCVKIDTWPPRLGGIKQTRHIIYFGASSWFLLFYSPEPQCQVWILIYRNWSIVTHYFFTFQCSGVQGITLASRGKANPVLRTGNHGDPYHSVITQNGSSLTPSKFNFLKEGYIRNPNKFTQGWSNRSNDWDIPDVCTSP